MKSSTQVILPFLVLAGMLNDAQARCRGLSHRVCENTRGCTWISGRCFLDLILHTDSDADEHDYELLPWINDAQGNACVVILDRRLCENQRGCTWSSQSSACVSIFGSAQATLFDVIPSDPDAHDDYELLHKKEVSFRAIDKHIDSTGHSESGDDVSDYEYDYDYGNDPEYDVYPYDEDMDEDENINSDSDEYNDNLYPYGDDMDEDEDVNSSSLDYGEPNANGDDSIIRKYLRTN